MPQPDPTRAKRRRALVLAGGLGFLASALILLVSIIVFRPDRPILWPPSSRMLYLIAHAIFGTLLSVLLIGLIYLTILLIAVLAGRMTLGDLVRRLLPPAIFIAMVAATIELSLVAFYWPWAVASATETVLAPPEKWRLISCAEVLADHSNRRSDSRLIHALHASPPPVRASVAYALAAAGDRDALLVLVEIASLLPDEPPPAGIPPNETGVSSSADALYLLGRLTEETFDSIEDLDDRLGPGLSTLRWDPESHLWSISPPASRPVKASPAESPPPP